MKLQTIRNLSVALLAASTLFAQEPQRLKFEVPFGFHVGDKILPSGMYTLETNTVGNMMRVRSVDCKASAMTLSNAIGPSATPHQARLIFTRYGEQYFLSEVWPLDIGGRALLKTKLEKEQAVATHSRDREVIILAAR